MSCEVSKAAGIAKALITGCVVSAAMITAHAACASDSRHSPSAERAARSLGTETSARVAHSYRVVHSLRRKHQHSAAFRPTRMRRAQARPATVPAVAGAEGATVALKKPKPDFTGKQRRGIASFYADNFGGKPMADGLPMNLEGNNAASRTLPLGTKAKVTNLQTGKSATVVIEDRGPYVDGRIVDLSPATARKIGITRRQGISQVVVAPITVPQPDGTVKLGAAARRTSGPLREAALDVHAR